MQQKLLSTTPKSVRKTKKKKEKRKTTSVKSVMKRWQQNRQRNQFMQKKQRRSKANDNEPDPEPAFTLVDAIKHIFTHREVDEIETLLDSYPSDVQQIIASFLGPSWVVLNPHEEVWQLHKRLIASQEWKKSRFLFQRQHFFRYKVAQSKSELSEDLEATKPDTANAANSQSDNASKASNAKAKSPKSKSPKSKSSTKKKLRGFGAGMIAKFRSAIGESHRNRKKYHVGLHKWARDEVRRIREAPIPKSAVRLVFIRHCEGYHNAGLNFGSFQHRDASLTRLGLEQGLCTGAALRSVAFDHVLLSPMTRCLETACMVFYGRWHEFSTVITPLAREFHPFSKMVGNEGSSPRELLERFKDFPQFDFRTTISSFPSHDCAHLPRRRVARQHVKTASQILRRDSTGCDRVIRRQLLTSSYKQRTGVSPLVDRSAGDCETPTNRRRSVDSGDPLPPPPLLNGQPSTQPLFETLPDNWCDVETVWDVDYRAKKMRQLIGGNLFARQNVVALVSHSHLFKTAFWGEEEMFNCEFRGFDIFPDGSFVRCGQKTSKGSKRRGQQHQMSWEQLVRFCDKCNGDKLLRGANKMGSQETGENQLLSYVAAQTPEVSSPRYVLDIATRRLLFLSNSIREKHVLSITPSTRAFHRYKGKNLASFFIDQCPANDHDDSGAASPDRKTRVNSLRLSPRDRLSRSVASTRNRSKAFGVAHSPTQAPTDDDGGASPSTRRPVWSLTAPSVDMKMVWVSAINSLAALPDSAILAPKELIRGSLQVSTRRPTAFKMRALTLSKHVGRSGFLVATDAKSNKVFELWVSHCTSVKIAAKRCEFSVKTHSMSWRLRASDEAERTEWVRHIKSIINFQIK